MTVGTRSVLYGAHCFLIHPWLVALAWWRLYGFPRDPRLWVAFFVHDLGYLGKPNMDGPEGEVHPLLGARIMSALFDRREIRRRGSARGRFWKTRVELGRWGFFVLLHSRYYAKRLKRRPSPLCAADKLALSMTPAWLYLPMAHATGEIHEYMAHARHRLAGNEAVTDAERALILGDAAKWFRGVQGYTARWAWAHRDGRADTWTSDSRRRAVLNDHGVWQ